MIYVIISIISAYLIGSIPTGYIFARTLKGIDIREHGSGNVGATNIFRVIGKWPGIMVFILDFLKGLISVTIIPGLFAASLSASPSTIKLMYILAGAAAIAGHIWTIFLRFKGGKGVATTAGVMGGLSPVVLLVGLLVWGVIFSIWKYVSLASICAAISLPLIALLIGKDIWFILFAAILCLVGVFTHRSNIRRLIQGTEKKIIKT